MAELSAIADAVVATLNAASLSQSFTAQRLYRPVFDLKEMKDLHVSVVPKKVTRAKAARSFAARDYEIDVGVQKRLPSVDNAEIDALVAFAEEIADLFQFERLADFPQALWAKTEIVALPDPEHLQELRQFTGVLTLTFRVTR